jgi:hypothetical protein
VVPAVIQIKPGIVPWHPLNHEDHMSYVLFILIMNMSALQVSTFNPPSLPTRPATDEPAFLQALEAASQPGDDGLSVEFV